MAPRGCAWGGCDATPRSGRYCDAHLVLAAQFTSAAAAQEVTPQLDFLASTQPPVPAVPTYRVPVRAHERTVVGSPPPSGLQLRAAAHERHETDTAKGVALRYVREQLAVLYRERARSWVALEPYVTSDDAWRILREWPQMPREVRELKTQAWMGSIFRGREWSQLPGRMVKSDPVLRPANHGALIGCWRWHPVTRAGGQ